MPSATIKTVDSSKSSTNYKKMKGGVAMELEKILGQLDPEEGKTEENIQALRALLDATGGREDEPCYDEIGQPLTRSQPSLASLKGGLELNRMPVRVARRMAQDILTTWLGKY